MGHLVRGAACRVTGTRASRRSTAAIFHAITVLLSSDPTPWTSRDPGSIGAALHPMLSEPLKAGPSSGPDGDRASWDELARLACRRRTLLRQLDAPRRRPQLSKAWRVYRLGKRKEGKLELRCEFTGESGNAEIVSLHQCIAPSFRGASAASEPGSQSQALNYFSGFPGSALTRRPGMTTVGVDARAFASPKGLRPRRRVTRFRAARA